MNIAKESELRLRSEGFTVAQNPAGKWEFWAPVAGNPHGASARIATSVEELDEVIAKLQGLREIASPSVPSTLCLECERVTPDSEMVGLICKPCSGWWLT